MEKTKNLYLVATQSNTLVSRMIRVYTRAPYNHVSIALDEGLEKMYSFARQKPPFAFPAGFMHETMEKSLFGMLDHVPCQVYSIPVTEKQYEDVVKLIGEFEKNINEYRFNIIGFATMILQMKLRRKRHFMCSQFVSYILTECDVMDFNKDYSIVKPDDIRCRKDMTLVYEGNLKQYIKEMIPA